MFNIFIGYDQREHLAAEVCKFSITQRSDKWTPFDIHYLKSENIAEYKRPRESTQSTDFTYTRFMIPYLNKYKGWSIFCDCDFLFQHDIMDLFLRVDQDKAISVVQHPPYVPHTQLKMDGIPQHPMKMKNWASLIVFNNAHPSNAKLTPEYVNGIMPGRLLHHFDWLQPSEIGALPLEWNTLDGYYLLDNPKAIHFTDGGPWFPEYKHTMYSARWWKEYNEYQQYHA